LPQSGERWDDTGRDERSEAAGQTDAAGRQPAASDPTASAGHRAATDGRLASTEPVDQTALLEAAAELERAVRQAVIDPHLSAVESAERLSRLEAQASQLLLAAAHVEDKADQVPTRRAVLLELLSWAQLGERLGMTEAARAARAAARRLMHQEVSDWCRSTRNALADCNADETFRLLLDTLVLHLDVLHTFPDDQPDLAELVELTERLRQHLERLVQGEEPGAAVRAGWVEALTDRADVVLRAIDRQPPDAAGRQLEVLAAHLKWHLRHVERRRSPERSKLRRKWARVEAEFEERTLQARMEARFGTRATAWIERLVLALILLVLVLLGIEFSTELTPQQLLWLHQADAVICAVFLWEFFVKLWLVPHRWRWFWRHFAVDFVPSIPFGLLLGAYGADTVRAARAGRLLRLPRLARYVRALRPAVQLLRAIGFLLRGVDRLVRLYGSFLNWDILLYPTRDERRSRVDRRAGPLEKLQAVLARLEELWRTLVLNAAPEERQQVLLKRVELLVSLPAAFCALGRSTTAVQPALTSTGDRQVLFEDFWATLSGLTAQRVKSLLPADLVARLDRLIRLFSHPPVCWLPVIRRYVPRLGPGMAPAEVIAAAGRKLAVLLRRYHERAYFLADLYGVITPPQFVDRVGSFLVRSTIRPASRLAIFGGVFLLTELLLRLLQWRALTVVREFLNRYIGPTLLVLGSLCLVVMLLGWWLQQLAREATDYLEKAAEAQFLALTELIRAERLKRDALALFHRVLRAEEQVEPAEEEMPEPEEFVRQVSDVLAGVYRSRGTRRAFDPVECVLLLHRDSLDGALLWLSDNRTTMQLLGNPAVRQFLKESWRADRRELARLKKLDLQKQQTLLGGPYLWFSLISRAIAQGTAKLALEYNRFAIPLAELRLASEEERQRYERWLRSDKVTDETVAEAVRREEFSTNAFTALHFLDCQPDRDRDVARRFGPEVLQKLRRDRALLFRRVFGTYPFHRWPREKRRLNFYLFYQRWFAGGRALLIPLRLVAALARRVVRLLAWLVEAVDQIRHPERRTDAADAAEADFFSAVRKIDRMRRPAVEESLRLRSWLDPEYLGVLLPHQEHLTLDGHDLEADLQFISAGPDLLDDLEQQRRRAEADMRRLRRLLDQGLLERVAERLQTSVQSLSTREHMRAAAVAYTADLRGVRSHLSAAEVLQEVFSAAPLQPLFPPRPWPQWRLRRLFGKAWKRFGRGDRAARLAAWRAVAHNHWGAADALRVWAERGEACREEGERILAEILRHPARVSEQLVTVRTIQTLAVLDVLNYREHVFRMGNYAADGLGEELLKWTSVEDSGVRTSDAQQVA